MLSRFYPPPDWPNKLRLQPISHQNVSVVLWSLILECFICWKSTFRMHLWPQDISMRNTLRWIGQVSPCTQPAEFHAKPFLSEVSINLMINKSETETNATLVSSLSSRQRFMSNKFSYIIVQKFCFFVCNSYNWSFITWDLSFRCIAVLFSTFLWFHKIIVV